MPNDFLHIRVVTGIISITIKLTVFFESVIAILRILLSFLLYHFEKKSSSESISAYKNIHVSFVTSGLVC